MPSSYLVLCCPFLLLPPIPRSIRVFSNESSLCMRWPKYWSFSFSIIPSKEHPGLISFRMDWLDLLTVQGTLKSLLQHHSSKASILRRSAFFTVQLSHPYMTTGKTIALTRPCPRSGPWWLPIVKNLEYYTGGNLSNNETRHSKNTAECSKGPSKRQSPRVTGCSGRRLTRAGPRPFLSYPESSFSLLP